MEVHTIGIMFDVPTTGDFPTLDEISRTNFCNTYGLDVDAMSDWFAIAYDPRGLMYGEDDVEAMDETNFASLVDSLRVELSEIPRVRDDMDTHYKFHTVGVDAARESGIALIDGCLVIAPWAADEDEWLTDIAKDCKRALSDYPLLDDEAYSAREWGAWQEYAPTALDDEIRDARRDESVDEPTLDRIAELSTDLLPILASHLHYEYGFSGEYGPNFLEIFADLLAADDVTFLDVWNPLRARTLRENVQTALDV